MVTVPKLAVLLVLANFSFCLSSGPMFQLYCHCSSIFHTSKVWAILLYGKLVSDVWKWIVNGNSVGPLHRQEI